MRKEMAKQVIVMRKDLKNKNGQKVRTGKLIAQGAHASLAVILNMGEIVQFHGEEYGHVHIPLDKACYDWFVNKFTKICLAVDSEEELLEINEKAKKENLPMALIQDCGLTEFDNPTYTCLAIGPAEIEKIDKITGHLKLF